jgi:hypothetical protein
MFGKMLKSMQNPITPLALRESLWHTIALQKSSLLWEQLLSVRFGCFIVNPKNMLLTNFNIQT